MLWLTLIGAIVSAWALLRLLGGERQERLFDMQTRLDAEAKAAQEAADAAAAQSRRAA